MSSLKIGRVLGVVLVKVVIVVAIVALPSGLAISLGAAHAGIMIAAIGAVAAALVVRWWRRRVAPVPRPQPSGEPLVAEGSVRTTRPSRYLGQLCRHANGMGHAVLAKHAGMAAQDRPEVLRVEHSETEGVLDLSLGRCTMRAGDDTLTLRVEAPDEESLQRFKGILTRDLERFGQREQLHVTWQS